MRISVNFLYKRLDTVADRLEQVGARVGLGVGRGARRFERGRASQ